MFWDSLLIPSSADNQHCVTTQKNEDLIYTTVESWNFYMIAYVFSDNQHIKKK